MAIRTRRRSTLKQAVANNAPPTPADAAAVWWADDIAQADGSQVATWTDRVNSNIVAQATGGDQPMFDVDGVGGRASVNFTAGDFMALLATNPVSTSLSGCVVAVAKQSAVSGFQVMWSTSLTADSDSYMDDYTDYDAFGFQGAPNSSGWYSQGYTMTTNDHVREVSSVGIGTDWTLRINNSVISTNGGGVSSKRGTWFGNITRDRFTFGRLTYAGGTYPWTGRLAYFGVFNSSLSAQDRTNLYNWIENYYGISIP